MSYARCPFEERPCAHAWAGVVAKRGEELVLLIYDCEAKQSKEAGIMRRKREILTRRQGDLDLILKKRGCRTFFTRKIRDWVECRCASLIRVPG